MIAHIGHGPDLAYAARKRGARVLGGSVCGRTLAEARAEIRAAQALRPDVRRRVVKIQLSAESGRHLTDEKWLDCAERVARHLGYGRCPFVVIRHTDTGRDHVHMEISPITIDGHVVDRGHDYYRVQQILREIEQTERLQRVLCSWENPGRQYNRADIRRLLRREMPFAESVRPALEASLAASGSWTELTARLAEHGLALERARTGLVISRDNARVALSHALPGLSIHTLHQRFEDHDRATKKEVAQRQGPSPAATGELRHRIGLRPWADPGSAGADRVPGGGAPRRVTGDGRAEPDRPGDPGREQSHGSSDIGSAKRGARRRTPDEPAAGTAHQAGGPAAGGGDQEHRTAEQIIMDDGGRGGAHDDSDHRDRPDVGHPGMDAEPGAAGAPTVRGMGGSDVSRDDSRSERADERSTASGTTAACPPDHGEIDHLLAHYRTEVERARKIGRLQSRRTTLEHRLERAASAELRRDRASAELDHVLRAHTGLPGRIRAWIDGARRTQPADEVVNTIRGRHGPIVADALVMLCRTEQDQLLWSERGAIEVELQACSRDLRDLRQHSGPTLRKLKRQIHEAWDTAPPSVRRRLSAANQALLQELGIGVVLVR